MLILNMLLGIDDLDPYFGPTIEVLNDFMNFGTRNNGIFIAWTLGKFHFKIEICSLVIHKT